MTGQSSGSVLSYILCVSVEYNSPRYRSRFVSTDLLLALHFSSTTSNAACTLYCRSSSWSMPEVAMNCGEFWESKYHKNQVIIQQPFITHRFLDYPSIKFTHILADYSHTDRRHDDKVWTRWDSSYDYNYNNSLCLHEQLIISVLHIFSISAATWSFSGHLQCLYHHA